MEKHNWIRNPFVDNANASQGFTSLEAEQFMDLSSDFILKSLYNLNLLISFWFKAQFECHLWAVKLSVFLRHLQLRHFCVKPVFLR